ncbi:MAG: NUDIX domain-containing protein [Acidimicrobiia bacterium]|nr:NUDIX domain-containing protein [Acidimicrobiia bacterium]
MDNRVYGILLRAFGRLPRRARRALIHWGAPSFSVGAMCVIERDGRVLLVRQSYRDGWGAPGGLLRRGEEPAVGARREAEEEVGLEVDVLGEPVVIIDVKVRRIDVVFRCRIKPPVPDPVAPTSVEIVEARWFSTAGLPTVQKETAEALRRVL